jgi:hypothetical protein
MIVTHYSPDVDAITSVWLLRRFLPGWDDAEIAFVPAGKTLDNNIVDSDKDIMHVDTGLGRLDHHQTDEDTCAARRTLEYIKKTKNKEQRTKNNKNNFPDEALERLVDIVNDIDHFHEVYYPNPTADYYDFNLVAIFDGLKLIYPDNNGKLIDFGMLSLDGIYKTFQNKVWAEKEIKEQGMEFKTKWGKGIGVETINDEVVRIAQRQGYIIAVRKDPKKGYVRIKAQPQSGVDFTSCYNRYKRLDRDATWYLHAGRKMILNGSMKNPATRATKLTLREIIKVLKSV